MLDLFRLRILKTVFAFRHPQCWPALMRGVAPSIEHRRVLFDLRPDLLMDVGANRGQFTMMARIIDPRLPVRAYEPLPSAAAVYRSIHGTRPDIELYELALGDHSGLAELHVSGQADSSSLLPIGELQARLFPNTAEVGTIRVRVAPLDSFVDHWKDAERALLKLDVQGFELNVLRGATQALQHCAFVYVECSEIALYPGQALRLDIEAFLREQGFSLQRRFNPSFAEGRLVQADYLFRRG